MEYNADRIVGLAGDILILPNHYIEIVNYLKTEEVDIPKLVSLIEKDVGFVEVLMRAANSPYYGGVKVNTIKQAVIRIGLEAIHGFVYGVMVYRLVKAGGLFERTIWDHSVEVAEYARTMAEEFGIDPDEAYVHGILHDAGWIILHMILPDTTEQIIRAILDRLRSDSEITIHDCVEEIERSTWNMTHAEIGVALLKKWNLEGRILTAVAEHHRPVSNEGKLLWLAELASFRSRQS